MADTTRKAAQGQAHCPMGGLRARALELARTEVGTREDDGANRDKEGKIAGYLSGCVRDGKRLALGPSPWCAAFVSWCVWSAWYREHARSCEQCAALRSFDELASGWHSDTASEYAPLGYRAAVAELVADARATGALRLPSEATRPEVGDVLIFARGTGNPLRGGEGHCGFAVAVDDETVSVLGGNQGDAVSIEARSLADVLAWISLG